MKAQEKLLQDKDAYIEFIGKNDKPTVLEALKDGGRDTVLRLCLWRNQKHAH